MAQAIPRWPRSRSATRPAPPLATSERSPKRLTSLTCECANTSNVVSGGGLIVRLVDVPDAECRAECRLEVNSSLTENKRCGHLPRFDDDFFDFDNNGGMSPAEIEAMMRKRVADQLSSIRMAVHAANAP